MQDLTNISVPKISIVMPVYNGASCIEDALCSILGQSFSDFELIILDDGSTDDTVEIIQEYADERICLYRCRHDFIASLNRGISLAKGDYIVRMDADDKMFPDRLAEQFRFMEEHPDIAVCGSWARTFGASDELLRTPEQDVDIRVGLLYYNVLIHPSAIIRRQAVDNFMRAKNRSELYDRDYIYAEDYKLWVEMALSGFRFANLSKVLLLYRRSDSQVTSLFLDQVMRKTGDVQRYYVEALIRELPDDVSSWYIQSMEMPESLPVVKKRLSEALFWKDEIYNYIRWYKGEIPRLYFTPPPLPEQCIEWDTVQMSAIFTWTELHQKPKYLKSLRLSPDAFTGKKVLDIGAGPVPSGTCFDDCQLFCLDPLNPVYRMLGFPQDLYTDVVFINDPAEQISVEDCFFDAIISVNAIDHVDCLEKVAEELQRVAKPGCSFAMHVHYHNATVYEPIEIDDEMFSRLFGWVDGLRKVGRSQESYSRSVGEGEEFVLWSNMHS
ncbi:glycosyltransferase [uncultured Parabacteroides sp.]|uniref:glycosyltransferase n=1 Tax=uncultured Parabacteroides sp. TaxID=512312 RepID=UPI002626A35D|nr:glycosyltransferase [uncultured Parabacteroides sp.]